MLLVFAQDFDDLDIYIELINFDRPSGPKFDARKIFSKECRQIAGKGF